MSKSILYILCALLVWLPIPLGSNRPWAWSISESIVFLLFSLHIVNFYINKVPFYPPKETKSIFLLIGSLLIVICFHLGLNASIDTVQTQIVFLKTLSFFMFAWLTCIYANSRHGIKSIIYALLVSGFIQASYATYLNLSPEQTSFVFNLEHVDRANGSFIYHNHLASLLGLTLCMGIGLIISQLSIAKPHFNNKRQVFKNIVEGLISNKLLIRLCLVVIVIALLLTRSRMGNIAFFIALILTCLFALRFYNNKPWSFNYIVVSFFALDIILVGSLFGADKLQSRLMETSFVEETRDEVIIDSIELIFEKPILGHGAGSFYGIFPQKQSLPYSGFYDHAHNEYIQFAVEFGLLASTTALIILLYIFSLSLRVLHKRTRPFYKGISFGVATAILFMLLHILVDFPLQATANAMTFIAILCIGLLCAKKGERKV